MQWILVCNSNVFDLKGALKENNVIDWPQVDNVVVGDIVYFYMSLPYDSILFKCQVESVNRHRMEESTKKYIKHPLFYDNRQTYMQLRLLETYPEALIKGKDIMEKGFHNLQMSSRVPDDFSKYVEKKEIGGLGKKSIKWLIGIAILLIGTIIFFVIPSKPEPTSNPEIMINQDLLKYSDMTHAEFKKETGIKATEFHTYMYTAQIPHTEVEAVFAATEYDENYRFVLKDSDKCFRLQGEIGSLLNGIEKEMTLDGFVNSLLWNGATAEYILEEGGEMVYFVSPKYAAVLFDSDGDGDTDALLNIDMYEKDMIGSTSRAWLFMGVEDFEWGNKEDEFEIENFDKEIFEPGNQEGSSVTEDTQSAENQLVCDTTTVTDYSQNLDPEEYSFYQSEQDREFNFYYPSKLYNKVEISKNEGIKYSYGTVLEYILFSGSDNESSACFELIKRVPGNTRTEVTQQLYNNYEQNMIGFQKVIFHDGADERPGRMIVIGYTDSSQNVMTYLLVQITDEYITRMNIEFPTDGNRETEDFWQKEYVVECMYRLCGFSGSSKVPQTYQEFYATKQAAILKNVSNSTIAIKTDLRKYQNLTYSQYKEMTGADVGHWRDNVFGGDIPNLNVSVAFRASYFDWDNWYQLQDHDLCYRLEGTLGVLLEGIEGEMTIEDLQKALSHGNIVAKTEYGEGYAGVQTLSESWAVITFDSNQDGQYDTELHVDIMEKNTVNSETLAWIVFDLRDNNTEVLGWEE